jgi:uncharacterized protein
MLKSEDHLDALETFLMSLDDDAMMVSEFDGFCAGLIVCPEMIPPSEWLPHVWGPTGMPAFDDFAEMQKGMDLIMAHYNDVAMSLSPPHVQYAPIYEVDTRTDEVLWEAWIIGFELAMSLRGAAWVPMFDSEDEEISASATVMTILHDIVTGKSELDSESIAMAAEEAPDLLPKMVISLNDWTKAQYQPAPFLAPMAANISTAPVWTKKTGRNEPCSCGSGRKYKKCCGSN